jgi:hypothetical protein
MVRNPMNDLISRSALIEELKGFKVSLGDFVLGWVVDRVIERVEQMPTARNDEPLDEAVLCLLRDFGIEQPEPNILRVGNFEISDDGRGGAWFKFVGGADHENL